MEKGNIIIEIKEIRNQRLVQKGEAHMIDKIIEKAKADIKAAKTEAEVKAIEEAAKKEIDSTW